MKNFKTVWREWANCKVACLHMLLFLVCRFLYFAGVARIGVLFPKIFENTSQFSKILVEIGILMFSTILASTLATIFRFGRHRMSNVSVNRFCNHILHADYEMFTKMSCSSIVQSGDSIWKISAIGQFSCNIVINIWYVGVQLYSIWILMPSLLIPICIVYTVAVLIILVIFKYYTRLDEERENASRARISETNETINGFAEVRGFCTEEAHLQSQMKKQEKVIQLLFRKTVVGSMVSAGMNLGDGIGVLVAIGCMYSSLANGTVSPATAVAVVNFVWGMMDPLYSIIELVEAISEQVASLNKFAEVIEFENTTTSGSVRMTDFNDSIELENLSFAYDDSSDVLQNLNLKIRKGQKIGICGTSGGGKTTLFKLLAKYYDPTQGSIKIDGIDYRDLDVHSLRKKIGIVHQENHIFEGTIYENVSYGNEHSTEYEVIEACKKANLYEFIQSLPEKFQTNVGPRGLKLSGGQKQRIALARVFLQNPEIILLDEATSALDNESETLIQEALSKFKDRTVITIAHRLSTIRESDQIYVIGNHGVMEHGTHEELVKLNGVYASLLK